MREIYHEKFMEAALHEAEKARQLGEIPIGCVIVREGKIIACAHNLSETTKNPLAHAELLAITEAVVGRSMRYLTDCTLYSTLEPCGMCAGALARVRPALCVFGAFDEEFGCLVSSCRLQRHMGYDFPVIGGVLEEKCSALINDYFDILRAECKKRKSN